MNIVLLLSAKLIRFFATARLSLSWKGEPKIRRVTVSHLPAYHQQRLPRSNGLSTDLRSAVESDPPPQVAKNHWICLLECGTRLRTEDLSSTPAIHVENHDDSVSPALPTTSTGHSRKPSDPTLLSPGILKPGRRSIDTPADER